MVRYYQADVSPSHFTRVEGSVRAENLTELESDRLSNINSRSTCITFFYMRKLPCIQELLAMCPAYPAQSVVVAPHQQLWCFLVFPTIYDKEMAEKQLDCSTYKDGEVRVDWSRKMVPLAREDLERSRQWSSLAVHGVSGGTSRRDLEEAFPGALNINIAKRGGSAFIQFRDTEEAEREFRRAEMLSVRGWRVVVMFSHTLVGLGRKGDLRGKLRQKMAERDSRRTAHEKWKKLEELKNKGGVKRSRSCERSRSRSVLIRYKKKSNYPDLTNVKDRYMVEAHQGEREDVKITLIKDNKASPSVKKESLSPGNISRSSSISLSPSPIKQTKKPLSQIVKPDQSIQLQEAVSKNSGEYDLLYRVLVTQLVGVGLSGKLAHGRAADIVNVWVETGYQMDQLREVMDMCKGKEVQRKELCRIVKEKCRRKAKKMNIDIVAMVDITIAFLLETRDEREKVKDSQYLNRSMFPSLCKFMEKELSTLGMKNTSVKDEIAKVVHALAKLKLSVERVEAEYICLVGDGQMGGLTEFHKNLEDKLADVGFSSKYLSPRLAAGLVMEYLQGKEDVKTAVEKNKKVFVDVDKALSSASKLLSTSQALHCGEGYPRMGMVLACRLFKICRMSEEQCLKMARSMVGVWVNFGFDYLDMRKMYDKEMLGMEKDADNVSLMGMRRLLHCRLRAKIDQGFSKPKSFGFSKLIDLTIHHFENAA